MSNRITRRRTTALARAIAALIFLAVVALGGCSPSAELISQREIIGEQITEIDSLRAQNRALYEQLGILQDSLQFIDDIETGQYYRDMRSLQDRIRQLEFALYQKDRGITVAELPADRLFEPASSTLTSSGQALLDSVAVILDRTFPTHSIRIEGHADESPLGPSLVEKYGSNWGLSTARAAAVLDYLLEEYEMEASRLAAVGFGSSRPIASNETAAGRRQNRRVRVAVVPNQDPASESTIDEDTPRSED